MDIFHCFTPSLYLKWTYFIGILLKNTIDLGKAEHLPKSEPVKNGREK